jgi:hypothetical protein
MNAAWTSLIAVAGTLLGVCVSYLFQRQAASRTERFAREEALRQERITVYSSYAAAIVSYRSGQLDRWHRRDEDPDGEAHRVARMESYRLRGVALQQLFRVHLLADSSEITTLAQRAFDAAAEIHHPRQEAQRRELGVLARAAAQDFVLAAARQVR